MAKKKGSRFSSSNGFTPITVGSRRSGATSSGASTRAFSMFTPSSGSSSGFTPITVGGKLSAAQDGTLYSTQQAATAAGYGPTGDYASKAQSWMQRVAARRINRRYMGGGMDQGYTSLLGYYYRARARAGLEQIAPQPTTVKEIVQWLSQRPGDDDFRQDRGAMFTVIFRKAAKEARAAGDSDSEETLVDAASKARKMARAQRRARRQAAAEGFNEFATGQYDEDFGYTRNPLVPTSYLDKHAKAARDAAKKNPDFDLQGIVEDAHSSFQMAPVPLKAAVVLGVAYALKKIL